MKTKSAISYFGSDSEVAGRLASYLNHCRHVTIPFCGGMAILPHLTARAVVANDMHQQAINFYRHIGGRFGDVAKQQLIEMCQSTLSHPAEMRMAKTYCQRADYNDTVEQAWGFWALCWIGRKGTGGTKKQDGMPSVRRSAEGGNNASRLNAAAGDLAEWALQFERCEWECSDFRNVLEKVADRPDCGIYCDPPWIGAGDAYLHSFTAGDHEQLALYLQRFHETTVLVRYGDCQEVQDLYSGWHFIEAECRTQANSNKPEVWILNRLPQQDQ